MADHGTSDYHSRRPSSPPRAVPLSPTSHFFGPQKAMSQNASFYRSAPSSSYSMRPAPPVAADDIRSVSRYKQPSSPHPTYMPYHQDTASINRLPSGYSKDGLYPPPYTYTSTPVSKCARGYKSEPALHRDSRKGGIFSKILNLFRKDGKHRIKDSEDLDWPPRGAKYLRDPNLPVRLISPFDPEFHKLKARTLEEWDEHRRITGGRGKFN